MNHAVLVVLAAAVLPQSRGAEDPRRLAIEFLYLDTTECTRCIDTGARLDEALTLLRPIMEETGWTAHLTKTHVISEEQARELRFASSPTVRINGQDIQLESRESVCGDCGKLCKDAAVTCREWRYRDQWFTSPPKGLFVDAILSAMHDTGSLIPGRGAAKATTPFEVPANLKRFFATKAASTSRPGCCSAGGENSADAGCCASRTTAKSKDGCCESEGSPKSPAATEAACTLDAESRAARKGVLKGLMSGAVERRKLENGIAFRFKPEPGLVTRLASLIELERTCCAFLTFGIRIEERGGPVWLDITGPPSAKKLIDEYFGQ